MNKLKRSIKNRGIIKTFIYTFGTIFYKIIRFFYDPILNKIPLKENYILFDSIPDFSDNSKALYEYMLKNKNYKFIWLVNNNKIYQNKNNTIFINKESKLHKGPTFKALFYVSISKQIYFTHGSPLNTLKKKENQMIINLWHGCGYKKVNKERKSFIDMNYFDYVLVPGKIFIDTKTDFFGCEKNQVLDIGYPRYDAFFQENILASNFAQKMKNGNKLIMWMPTFRKTGDNYYPEESIDCSFELPLLESLDNLIDLNKLCKKKNVTLCIKRHPLQIRYNCESQKLSNIIFIDNNTLTEEKIDLYALMKYTDGLITDYSSIAIDYILLDKPIAFTLDDYEEYEKTRGFVFDDAKAYMPGHHIYLYNDLVEYIEDVSKNNDKYKNNRSQIMQLVHNKCNNYCERIVNTINNKGVKKND